MTDIVLCCLVWGFVVYSIYRGYRRERRVERYELLTWTIFLSIAVVFTFRIEGMRSLVDGFFEGYPIALLIQLLAVVTACAAYSLSLKWVVERSSQVYHWNTYQNWLIYAGLGVAILLVILVIAIWAGQPRFEMQSLMQWLIEGYGMLLSAFLLVPINLHLFRQEQIFAMKVKHLAVLIFCVTFAVTAAYSVVYIPWMLLTNQSHPDLYLPPPRGLITALCLIVMLVPHRWLTLLLLPRRLYQYARLAALERHLSTLVPIRRERRPWWHVFRPQYLEQDIYDILISIFDHYRQADLRDPLACELYAQIRALPPQVAYDALVETICRVKL